VSDGFFSRRPITKLQLQAALLIVFESPFQKGMTKNTLRKRGTTGAAAAAVDKPGPLTGKTPLGLTSSSLARQAVLRRRFLAHQALLSALQRLLDQVHMRE
jgi:hypothetical protein